jgi:GTP-binding protein HflX
MIEAFKSTLEESLMADVILLLIDSSQSVNEIRIKYSSCWQTLDELRVDREKVFVIFTKCDNAEQMRIQEIATDLGMLNPIATSAKTGYGIHKLKNLIAQRILLKTSGKKIKIPA